MFPTKDTEKTGKNRKIPFTGFIFPTVKIAFTFKYYDILIHFR